MNHRQQHTQSYYRLDNSPDGCNISDASRRLIVNCSGVCVLDKPFRTALPAGRHDFYLMYVTAGELEASSGETHFHLTAGNAVIYPPETGYAYQKHLSERMIYLWIHFTGAQAESLLAERGIDMARPHPIGLSEEIEGLFEAIQHLFITRPAFYPEEASSLLELLLTRIGRAVYSTSGGTVNPSERLKTSLNHLNRHYAEPLRLETLASMEYLSVSRYSALFRGIMGLSPQQYLIELRLRNAREMLVSTDLSITEVARSVGYDDALYFSRLFRRHFGLPPSVVRRNRAK